MSLLQHVTDSYERVIDKYNIQLTCYIFQSNEYIEIKVYEYELFFILLMMSIITINKKIKIL